MKLTELLLAIEAAGQRLACVAGQLQLRGGRNISIHLTSGSRCKPVGVIGRWRR